MGRQVSKADLAEIVGRDERTLSRWQREGMPVHEIGLGRGNENQYDTEEVIGWLVQVIFPLAPLRYDGRVHPLWLLWLLAVFLYDLATASIRLAGYAFRRDPTPKPGIVAVRLASESDLYQVATATLLSIVPGTIVVDLRSRGRTLYLHVFDLGDEGNVADEVRSALGSERRVLRAFASKAQIEAAERKGER